MKPLFFLFFLIAASCGRIEKQTQDTNDFESLMGKALPAWKHVQTAEDFENLQFFKTVYEKNLPFLGKAMQEIKIPKVIHFIWIGPKPFPRESIENVRSWIAKNPDWKIKFWTDRKRPLPHPQMEEVLIKEFPFFKLGRFYKGSDNYGEKSDLLRLEILYREGGVYVDHDVKCLHSFEELNYAYDLYCGMEVPYPTALSSSVLPTNNLLAAKPHHPLLEKCMDWLVEKWDQIENDYPGKDKDSVINRISHRTFLVLGENFKKFANQNDCRDIAFPSYYFNSPKEEWALYAQHKYAGTWFENETVFEKTTRQRLMMLSKKTNKLLLAIGILAGVNMLGFAVLIVFLRRKIS